MMAFVSFPAQSVRAEVPLDQTTCGQRGAEIKAPDSEVHRFMAGTVRSRDREAVQHGHPVWCRCVSRQERPVLAKLVRRPQPLHRPTPSSLEAGS